MPVESLEVVVDGLRTTTGLNVRERWQARKRRVQHERRAVWTRLWLTFKGCMPGDPSEFRSRVGKGPFLVTLTRIGPRLADDDNVVGGLKSVRDEVADWLGTGDSPTSPVRWRYSQAKGPWGVRIRIDPDSGSVP